MTALLAAVKMLGQRPVSSGLRLAWSEPRDVRLTMGETEGLA
jgi:hypothetical protein